MKIVGLTGGIATGKSTVTALLRKHHIPVIDCDDIAHAITEKVGPLHVPSCAPGCVHGQLKRAVRPMQGEWGYRRVLRAFGTGILRSDGRARQWPP